MVLHGDGELGVVLSFLWAAFLGAMASLSLLLANRYLPTPPAAKADGGDQTEVKQWTGKLVTFAALAAFWGGFFGVRGDFLGGTEELRAIIAGVSWPAIIKGFQLKDLSAKSFASGLEQGTAQSVEMAKKFNTEITEPQITRLEEKNRELERQVAQLLAQ